MKMERQIVPCAGRCSSPGPLSSVYGFHMRAQRAKPHGSAGRRPHGGEATEKDCGGKVSILLAFIVAP